MILLLLFTVDVSQTMEEEDDSKSDVVMGNLSSVFIILF